MKLLDLMVLPEKKVSWHIRKVCGGKLRLMDRIFGNGIGIGGMYYEGGVEQIEEEKIISDPLRSNVELFKAGYGIYFNNSRQHYLLLIPKVELEQVLLFRHSLDPDLETSVEAVNNGDAGSLRMQILLFSGLSVALKFINASESSILKKLANIFGNDKIRFE